VLAPINLYKQKSLPLFPSFTELLPLVYTSTPPVTVFPVQGRQGERRRTLGNTSLFSSTLALEECRSEGILGMVLQSWVPFVNYNLAPFFVFDKYKPHFVFHKLVPISS